MQQACGAAELARHPWSYRPSQSLRFVDLIVNLGVAFGAFLQATATLPPLLFVILPFALRCCFLPMSEQGEKTSSGECGGLEQSAGGQARAPPSCRPPARRRPGEPPGLPLAADRAAPGGLSPALATRPPSLVAVLGMTTSLPGEDG